MQANTYLDYEGPLKDKGEATAKGYENQITLLSVDWNVSRELTSFTGTARDREASAARLGEVTITKLQDKASTYFFHEATVGKGQKAIFHVTKQGEEGLDEIMTIELTDAMISSYSVSVQGDRPVETITISYTEMVNSVFEYDDKNLASSNHRHGYSCVTGHKM